MRKQCAATGQEFEISDAELEFLKTMAPTFAGQRFELPIPSLCPEERQRRRLAFRNLRYLHKRACDLTGKPIISMYAPETPLKVFHNSDWWSDAWDPMDYGREFDFTRPFCEQFAELYREVPTLHAYVILSENCEYINGAANCRNCYLAYNMDYCEDCYYVFTATHSRSSIDCHAIHNSELCYQCIDCSNCYELRYSERSTNCSASYFLRDCRRCKNCIGCANLVDKEYYIFNQPATRAEYERYRERLMSASGVAEVRAKVAQHFKQFPYRYYVGHSNESFSGTALHHAKNSYGCFESFEIENCLHCNYLFHSSNCADINVFGDHSQWLYNCLATGINCTNDMFTMGCWGGSSNVLYSVVVNSSSDCFGCCGLTQKKHCILNRQYTPEDYQSTVAAIISHMQRTGEWGQFFPPTMTPFAFNRSMAFDEYPLTKAEALARGYRWEEETLEPATASRTLEDDIRSAADSVCSQSHQCVETGKQYRIIPPELKLYRDLGIPLPDNCPERRFLNLLKVRGPRSLWKRNCSGCAVLLDTDISRERSESVLCEKCFQEALA